MAARLSHRAFNTSNRPHLRVLTLARPFSSTFSPHATIPFIISGSGNGVAQSITVSGSPHRITTDAYTAFGGQDSAPSPLHYNLSALSSCTQVTGSIVAKDHGIKLSEWEVSVEGQLDPSVLVEGKEGNANWKSIALKVRVGAETDESGFEKWSSEVERRCPVTQLFKRSGVEWSSDWQKK